mgnify:CR=1 FL=1
MMLRGKNFGDVFCASGARNFFGEGYWFHRYGKKLGLDFTGSTLISKTTTLTERPGNMPLKKGSTMPVETAPKCIIVKPAKGIALNAVGLSGPGAPWLFAQNRWQNIIDPFVISFMAVGAKPEDRLAEYQNFAYLVAYAKETTKFKAPFALQINASCPNVGLNLESVVTETTQALHKLSSLQIPLVVKVNALVTPEAAKELASVPECDAICCSNTIPWGKLPDRIDWQQLFGTTESPLAHLGGGGLSGSPLLPIVCDWIAEARKIGVKKPIMGCGGILSVQDADLMLEAGASAIELGSVAFLRPWRVQSIIRHVRSQFITRAIYRSFGIEKPPQRSEE